MDRMTEEAIELRHEHERTGATIDLMPFEGEIGLDLYSLPVEMQGQGYGTRFMRDLCEVADRHQAPVRLEASSYHHPKKRPREIGQKPLEAFYRRFGFEPTGEAGPGGRPEMLRRPQPIKTEIDA